jgi:SNW domain-containing protein 1
VYDKPWRTENSLSNHLYRPPKNRDGELYGDDIEEIAKTKRFVPDKGFDGADAGARGAGPVQFEKDQDDVFGLDKLLADVKRVKFYLKKKHFLVRKIFDRNYES